MSDEKCVNCGKVQADHEFGYGGDLWCYRAPKMSKWKQPAPVPQAALFETGAIRTGYEL